jgi:glucose-6-phosphate 1-dehydrogenase
MNDPADVSTLIILGGSGDLAKRMLLPSLYYLDEDGLLPSDLKIIGVARGEGDGDSYTADVEALMKARGEELKPETWARFSARLDYCSADVTKADGATCVRGKVGGGVRVIFFALSPSLYSAACAGLGASGVIDEHTRLILEKPVGRDLASSRAINAAVAAVADESRVFRIDHYLGKETVQNLLALRFANTLFEPQWNAAAIDHVQITIAETEKVGDRWPYYDEYGALRDMLQNHLLQLLCLVAMEPPAKLDPDSTRDEKVKVLRSLKPPTRLTVLQDTVRGQYGAGVVEGQSATAYGAEVGRPSDTETFVALKVEIDNWRWAGVPFYLRTGKRMPEKRTQIAIHFKPLPHSIFGQSASEDLIANSLIIDLQPQEDISLVMMMKRPGLGDTRLQSLPLSLSLDETLGEDGGRRRIAYERLLLDALRGDRTLFVRRDEVEQAWAFVDAVADAWAQAGMKPKPYPAGSWGPSGAFALIERTGRTWND